MTSAAKTFLGLDVGDARIGVARGDTGVKLAHPVDTITVDGTEHEQLQTIIATVKPEAIIVGYPRNQQGDPTMQTEKVITFADTLKQFDVPLIFQDESLTSVHAEAQLKATKKPYSKADIDAAAAALILQDYLEQYHG